MSGRRKPAAAQTSCVEATIIPPNERWSAKYKVLAVIIRHDATTTPVAWALLEHYNWAHDVAFPSHDELEAWTRLSRQAVRRAIREISNIGVFRCVKGGGRGHTARYRIDWNLVFTAHAALPRLEKRGGRSTFSGEEKGLGASEKGAGDDAQKGQSPAPEPVVGTQSEPAAAPDDLPENWATKLQEAAGDVVVDAEDINVVRKWVEDGCDFDLDILPTVRKRSLGREPGSIRKLNYFNTPIREQRDQRRATEGTPSKPSTWILGDDPRWADLAARWEAEKGLPAFPQGSKHAAGIGWHFPSDWL